MTDQISLEAFWGHAFDGSDSPHGERVTFRGVSGARIEGIVFRQPKARGNLLCVPGKSESFVKYKALIWEWFCQLGLNVYLMDHRSQGLSERLTCDQQMVHVENYWHYARDLEQFCYRFMDRKATPLLFAHSMGAAVATLFMLDNPNFFKAAVLNAPMFRLRNQNLGSFIAESWVRYQCAIGRDRHYVRGYSQTTLEQWAKNLFRSTSCSEQVGLYRNVVQANEWVLKTHGISNRWAEQWFAGTRYIRRHAEEIEIPVLLFSAEREESVENDAHYVFASRASAVTHYCVKGARHEIHFERKAIRTPYLARVESFFQSFCP